VTGEPAEQRRFYDERPHAHLRPRTDDVYAAKLVRVLADAVGIGAGDRVLEVGAGFGRFTFPLLDHCASVVAVDLAPRPLETLEATRAARGVAPRRCAVRCLDVSALEPDALGERFRFVVGFFVLHHLPDHADAIRRLAAQLEPGGWLAFVEPNRWNPLFLAQVACAPDMTWAGERGMFRLSAAGVRRHFAAAGLVPRPVRRFGFFPPPVLNRVPIARRLETWLETRRLLRPVLPFLLLRARAVDTPAAP
jgi:SAM-dependent methyltransferase